MSEHTADYDRTAGVILRHRFVEVPGSDMGFCAGPYCAGGLVAPETHAAHVADMLRVTPPAESCVCDAFDYEAEGPCRVPGHDSRVTPIPPANGDAR